MAGGQAGPPPEAAGSGPDPVVSGRPITSAGSSIACARGQAAGARRDHPIKQHGWAQMQLKHQQSQALLYRAIDEAAIDPTEAAMITGWAAAATVMEHAAEVASLAIKVCGGQSMQKSLPLERMYRDARLGSTMLPRSAEVCFERLGRARLYDADEQQ